MRNLLTQIEAISLIGMPWIKLNQIYIYIIITCIFKETSCLQYVVLSILMNFEIMNFINSVNKYQWKYLIKFTFFITMWSDEKFSKRKLYNLTEYLHD